MAAQGGAEQARKARRYSCHQQPALVPLGLDPGGQQAGPGGGNLNRHPFPAHAGPQQVAQPGGAHGQGDQPGGHVFPAAQDCIKDQGHAVAALLAPAAVHQADQRAAGGQQHHQQGPGLPQMGHGQDAVAKDRRQHPGDGPRRSRQGQQDDALAQPAQGIPIQPFVHILPHLFDSVGPAGRRAYLQQCSTIRRRGQPSAAKRACFPIKKRPGPAGLGL